jgi:hypothetical protein
MKPAPSARCGRRLPPEARQAGDPRQPPRQARRGRDPLPRRRRLRPHGDPRAWSTRSSPATTSSCSACAARPRRASCAALVDLLDPEIPVLAGSELNDDPLAPISTTGPAAGRGDRRRRTGRVAAPGGALQREARDARRLDRRPARRHRPDQGGDPQADLRRPRGDPLRDHPAHQPRHLRDQRAARPGAAHPGRPAEHPRGARPADPRLPGAHPDRHPDGLLGQPGGLHEPRQHHHAAQGPHLLPDPHPLPAGRGDRGDDHRPGGLDRARWRGRRSREEVRLLVEEISLRRPGERPRRPDLRGLGAGGDRRPRAAGLEPRAPGPRHRRHAGPPAPGDLQMLLPAITGKVEMVYEGEQQGAEVVARQLVGEAARRSSTAASPRSARSSAAAARTTTAPTPGSSPGSPRERRGHAVRRAAVRRVRGRARQGAGPARDGRRGRPGGPRSGPSPPSCSSRGSTSTSSWPARTSTAGELQGAGQVPALEAAPPQLGRWQARHPLTTRRR